MKVAFHTLGCKVNSYETQAILEQFGASGFDIVDYDQFADVYVINTCSVTGEAARKSRQIINRAKKINPDAITVATGCYAQDDFKNLKSAADIIIGNNEKSRIAEIVLNKLNESSKKVDSEVIIDDLSGCYLYEDQKISNQGNHVRAYVKIQDGCDRFCSYCIIPYLRGRSRSRNKEDILNEVKKLIQNGYKEIVLTGIDISDYHLEGSGLADIIEAADNINGIERIRIGSLEEGIVDERFIKRLSKLNHLCPHFHLSLQSGSDSTLKRMNRKYNTKDFEAGVAIIRHYFKDPAITTDIIAGFPKETEKEFLETCEFIKKIKFSDAHVFKYSRRKGTAADKMEGQLTDKIKTERSKEIVKITKALSDEYKKIFIGKEKSVLFEERMIIDNTDYYTGFTSEYFKVKVKSDKDIINRIMSVKITEECLI